ncbi:MAG: hypothetical protein ACRENU_06330, partial [Gemmatimonadaceae bacterium]
MEPRLAEAALQGAEPGPAAEQPAALQGARLSAESCLPSEAPKLPERQVPPASRMAVVPTGAVAEPAGRLAGSDARRKEPGSANHRSMAVAMAAEAEKRAAQACSSAKQEELPRQTPVQTLEERQSEAPAGLAARRQQPREALDAARPAVRR